MSVTGTVSDVVHPTTLVSGVRDGSVAGVVTSRAYVVGGLLPTVYALRDALRALRGTGATPDVVGFAVPLVSDPAQGEAQVRGYVEERRSFDLKEFVMTAIDPHRPRGYSGRWGPGRNVAIATDILGDLTRWLVGIHAFRIHGAPDGEELWILARPNHAAAIHRVRGDSVEGASGVLATLAVPGEHMADVMAALVQGQCILTTCETDEGRMKRDLKIMRKAGARTFFNPAIQVVEYGVRPA